MCESWREISSCDKDRSFWGVPRGDEVMDCCARYRGPIHMLLTDLVIPGLSGGQLGETSAVVSKDQGPIHDGICGRQGGSPWVS